MPTGRTTLRGRGFLKSGEYHLVVHIWPVSPEGKILIQRRSDDKKLMPGEWAATGGAAIAAEDSQTAAIRELREELGLKRSFREIDKLIRFKKRNSFLDVWITLCNLPADRLTLQTEEVAEVKWVTPNELKQMIKDGKFHNYGNEYFNCLFKNIDDYTTAVV